MVLEKKVKEIKQNCDCFISPSICLWITYTWHNWKSKKTVYCSVNQRTQCYDDLQEPCDVQLIVRMVIQYKEWINRIQYYINAITKWLFSFVLSLFLFICCCCCCCLLLQLVSSGENQEVWAGSSDRFKKEAIASAATKADHPLVPRDSLRQAACRCLSAWREADRNSCLDGQMTNNFVTRTP